MKRRASALALALIVCFAPPALAAEEEDRAPAEMAREGIERFMRALEMFIEAIPQYEAPIINENGDIIIRRKRKKAPEQEPDKDKDKGKEGMEETRT